ncbi:MAG: M23 family metallopeptidase [Acidimicrobiales bacterium]
MSHIRLRPAPVLLAVGLLLATAAKVGAQTSPTTTSPTPTTTAPPTTKFLGIFPPSTTTAPPTTTKGTAPGPSATPPPSPGAPGPGGDGEPPPGTPKVIPPEFQRQIDAIRRTGPNNTTAWLAAIQPLVTEFGMTPTDAALTGAGQFPIAGPTTWVDDWHFPRFVPSFHLHKGLDMFAASGTPVRAPFDGMLKFSDGAVGGLAAYVTQPDGTYVYMAHLSGYAPGKATGQPVRQGEVVGFVGDTGNARGGAPHVHLQLHPKGGNPVPPKPTVDGWLKAAETAAPELIVSIRAARNPAPPPGSSASVTGVAEGTTGLSAEAAPAVDPFAALWAASSNPVIGTIDLASTLVASAARGVAWPAPSG